MPTVRFTFECHFRSSILHKCISYVLGIPSLIVTIVIYKVHPLWNKTKAFDAILAPKNVRPYGAEVGQYIEKYWKTNILVISILILILKSAISKYWYRYWYWNLPFIYIATNIDIEKNMNIDIGIDIDIGEIKSIFVDFYGIFTGLTYSIFKTNFVQLPLWFCQKLKYLLEVFTISLI